VALAHRLEALVRSGEVKDYVELAAIAYVSPARIAQIVILSQLAPDIQEYVLFTSITLTLDDGGVRKGKPRRVEEGR
jgi:hypothetical protein